MANDVMYVQYANGAVASLTWAQQDGVTQATPPGATVITQAQYNSAVSAANAALATLVTDTKNAEAATAAKNAESLTMARNPVFQASDHGLITWSDPPSLLNASTANLTAGVTYLTKVKILDAGTVVTNIKTVVTAAQTSGTAGQNFVGIYSSTGTRLALSADVTTTFSTTGEKTIPLTTPVTLPAGSYYVAALSNNAGAPALSVAAAVGSTSVAANNVGLSVSNGRFIASGSGSTTLPTSITLSSASFTPYSRWFGLT